MIVYPGLAREILDRIRLQYPDCSLIVVVGDNEKTNGNMAAAVHAPKELRDVFVAVAQVAIGIAAQNQGREDLPTAEEANKEFLRTLPDDGKKH